MSNYSSETTKCTCDEPTGSEYRRCSYCKSQREEVVRKKSKKRLFKYRVTFQTEVQVDGFSDWRDTEHEIFRQTVTVDARNVKHARKAAVKKAPSFCSRSWMGYRTFNWNDGNIKKVTRIKKSKP